MKMLVKVACALGLAVAAAGCGGGPKLPEGTFAAAYVDVAKGYAAAKGAAKTVIGEAPKNLNGKNVRQELEKEYGTAVAGLELSMSMLKLKPEDVKWALVGVSGVEALANGKDPAITLAVCAEGLDKAGIPFPPGRREVGGLKTYSMPEGGPLACGAVYAGKYFLAAGGESELEALIALYKGERPGAEGFEDLDDLDSGTVARLQIGGLDKLMEKTQVPTPGGMKSVAKAIMDAYEDVDEEMGRHITEMKGARLDLRLTDEEVGARLTAMCGSGDAAELVRRVFDAWAVLSRVGSGAAAAGLAEAGGAAAGMLSEFAAVAGVPGGAEAVPAELFGEKGLVKAVARHIAKAGRSVKASKDGAEAHIAFAADLEEIAEDVWEAMAEAGKKD